KITMKVTRSCVESSSARAVLILAAESSRMADRKAVIKNADMAEDMQQDAIDSATQALEKYNIEKDIAAFIKKEFDKKYNPTWHCVVGRNFGSYVTHETKHFIYFYLGQALSPFSLKMPTFISFVTSFTSFFISFLSSVLPSFLFFLFSLLVSFLVALFALSRPSLRNRLPETERRCSKTLRQQSGLSWAYVGRRLPKEKVELDLLNVDIY
ncbi:unnamed protein product, partial [Cladocopium goreaui]